MRTLLANPDAAIRDIIVTFLGICADVQESQFGAPLGKTDAVGLHSSLRCVHRWSEPG